MEQPMFDFGLRYTRQITDNVVYLALGKAKSTSPIAGVFYNFKEASLLTAAESQIYWKIITNKVEEEEL